METTGFSEAAIQAAELICAASPAGKIDYALIAPRAFEGVCDILENPTALPYAGLPGFPMVDGEARVGNFEGASVLFLLGAAPFHATGDPGLMSGPIETFATLGVRCALALDVAHSVNGFFGPGNLVAVSDHINFSGLDPLVGDATVASPIDMNEPYDARLLRRLKLAATTAGVTLHDGVLMWFSGPTYQTRAEARVARLFKADLLAWGVAPEAILARRMKLPFGAIVVIPGFAAGFSGGEPSAEQTQTGVKTGTMALRRLLRVFLRAS
jgi:purine-nucleoside phosphorylase